MSRANSTRKVLVTALKRVQKRWRQGRVIDVERDEDGQFKVCLIGSITQGATPGRQTQYQKEALALISEICHMKNEVGIAGYNDRKDRTLAEIEDVVKEAIIREETGGLLITPPSDRVPEGTRT